MRTRQRRNRSFKRQDNTQRRHPAHSSTLRRPKEPNTLPSTLVGIYRRQAKATYLEAEPYGETMAVLVPENLRVRDGDAVVCRRLTPMELQKQSRGRGRPSIVVEKILGDSQVPLVQAEMLIINQGLLLEFDTATTNEAAMLTEVDPHEVLRHDHHRQDLRSLAHVTIDGEDARDFDDAVCAQPEEHGVRVWVSIADVATYVRPKSALDRSAKARGTSVYLPHRAIPMLPEPLSNNLCSLRPNLPRLTLTCEMWLNAEGIPKKVSVYPSLIISQARLTYTEAQKVLDGKDPNHPLRTVLQHLVQASRWLRDARTRRGALDLDLPEIKVQLNARGEPTDVMLRERLEAHRLVEDLMIAANEAVAEFLLAHDRHTLFRVHEIPDVEKAATFITWAKKFGFDINPKLLHNPHTLAKIARTLHGKPQSQAGQMLLLRSLPQARYADENLGHYGLASRAYLHFTSPIRRYPDLVVHRTLWDFWQKRQPFGDLATLGEKTSEQERKAMEAERAVNQLLACFLARGHVGENFTATVTGVHERGVFVRTEKYFLEGLLEMRHLRQHFGSYYTVIPEEHTVVARGSKHRLTLGDKLEVQLLSVNLRRRFIDFGLTPRVSKTRG